MRSALDPRNNERKAIFESHRVPSPQLAAVSKFLYYKEEGGKNTGGDESEGVTSTT